MWKKSRKYREIKKIFIQINQYAPFMKRLREFEINTWREWQSGSMSLLKLHIFVVGLRKIAKTVVFASKNKINSVNIFSFLREEKKINRERERVEKKQHLHLSLSTAFASHIGQHIGAHSNLCNRFSCWYILSEKKEKIKRMLLRQNCFRWFLVSHQITVVSV